MLLLVVFFSSDNTWEPLEHLDCDDLVKNFEEDRDRKLKKQRIEDFIHKKKTVVEVVFFFVVCHSQNSFKTISMQY